MDIASRRSLQWALVVLRKRMVPMALVMVGALAIGLILYSIAPRQFMVYFDIDFQREELPKSVEQLIVKMFPTFRENLESERQRLLSESIIKPALRRMQVITPEMTNAEANALVGAYRGHVEVKQVGTSMMLHCVVKHSNPDTAYELACSILQQYEEDHIALRTKAEEAQRQNMQKCLEEFQHQYEEGQKALESSEKAADIERDIEALNTKIEELTAEMEGELKELQKQQKELSLRFKSRWPALERLNLEVDLLCALVEGGSKEDLKLKTARLLNRPQSKPYASESLLKKFDAWMEKNNERLALEEERGELQLDYQRKRSETLSANLTQQEIVDIEVKSHSLEELISEIQNTLPRLNMQMKSVVPNFRVLEEPKDPPAEISPTMTRYLSLAFSFGLLLALATAAFLEHLDHTLQTVEDFRHYVELEVLGVIPGLPITRESGKPMARLLFRPVTPPHPTVEAYRLLRTNILASLDREPNQHLALLIASTVPQEGKSTTACNLACAFAETGARTVLVGGNLRRPTIREFFDVEPLPGVCELMRGHVELDACIRETFLETLHVIPSGQVTQSAALLINNPKFDAFLEELRRRYDAVILDSPPGLLVTDALLIAPKVDATLIVYAQGQTQRESLQRFVEMLKRSRANVLGIILNQLKRAMGIGYYYYRYSKYGYGSSR